MLKNKEERSAAKTARDLRIPCSRVYNAQGAIGHKRDLLSAQEILALLVEIQQGAVPFTALAVELGEETTLGQLAELEMKLVREKYHKLWEKRSKVVKQKSKTVNFIT